MGKSPSPQGEKGVWGSPPTALTPRADGVRVAGARGDVMVLDDRLEGEPAQQGDQAVDARLPQNGGVLRQGRRRSRAGGNELQPADRFITRRKVPELRADDRKRLQRRAEGSWSSPLSFRLTQV